MTTTVLGAILAGGEARRFGSDKAMSLLDGAPLIAHVARALAPQVDAVVTVGRCYGGLPVLADRPHGGLGPLAAINAALHAATAAGHEAVLTTPCDVPLLPGDLRARLAGDGPSFVADLPLLGWWPVRLAGGLDDWLRTDARRSVRAWAEAIGAREVALPVAIANINRPEDLARLASEATKRGGGPMAG